MSKKNSKNPVARELEQKEFEEEILQIDRVTRVVKGGRRLRFRITVAIGDKKGRVGIGIGKAGEVAIAVKKAVASAKKALVTVPITDGDTIPHQVAIKYKAAHLMMMPAAPGTGVIAGGTLRKILSLAGVKNVLSKSFGTSNRVVTSQASIMALQKLRPVKASAKSKSEKVAEAATSNDEAEQKEKTSAKPAKKSSAKAK